MESRRLEFKLTFFNVSSVEQVIYQNGKSSTTALNNSQLAFLLLDQVAQLVAFQHIGERQNVCKRCSQLVRNRC